MAERITYVFLDHDDFFGSEVQVPRRVYGEDRAHVRAIAKIVASMQARDARLLQSNPKNRPLFFPASDANLTASLVVVLARMTTLLSM